MNKWLVFVYSKKSERLFNKNYNYENVMGFIGKVSLMFGCMHLIKFARFLSG